MCGFIKNVYCGGACVVEGIWICIRDASSIGTQESIDYYTQLSLRSFLGSFDQKLQLQRKFDPRDQLERLIPSGQRPVAVDDRGTVQIFAATPYSERTNCQVNSPQTSSVPQTLRIDSDSVSASVVEQTAPNSQQCVSCLCVHIMTG